MYFITQDIADSAPNLQIFLNEIIQPIRNRIPHFPFSREVTKDPVHSANHDELHSSVLRTGEYSITAASTIFKAAARTIGAAYTDARTTGAATSTNSTKLSRNKGTHVFKQLLY